MFKHYFLQESGLFKKVKTALLVQLHDLRMGATLTDSTLAKNIIFLFVDTGLFGELEPELFKEAMAQYEKINKQHNFGSYQSLEILAHYLLFEERTAELLAYPKETQMRLVKIAEEALLVAGLNGLVSSGLSVLVEASWKEGEESPKVSDPPMNDFSELQKSPEDRLFDLRLLVKLALRANGAEVLKSNWIRFIKAYGSAILASNRGTEMIEELLGFKERLERVLVEVFSREPTMENAMKEAFESFVNARSSKLAELIAKYFDSVLRDGKPRGVTERQSDAQIIQVIDGVVVLFRFLQSKEAVETYYKQLLAKRLLQSRSLSMELEREVVKRFKAECGAAFTSRLEGMFKDIDSAPELNRLFKEAYKPTAGFEVGLTVVSTGIWPHPEDTHLRLPKAIDEFQSAFETYYGEKHNGRKLVWNQNMGSCIIKATFAQGNKELLVSVPQAVVLDCFNANDALTFGELLKATKMESSVLHETLLTLTGRHPVLLREGGSADVPAKSDRFIYNAAFTSRLVRIRLNTSAVREAVDDASSGVTGPSAPIPIEDLQFRIDAAIVRTAKSAKRMPRSQLVEQSMAALAIEGIGKAEFEKRIDVLLTRDFLDKDPENACTLTYVP